MVLVLCTTNINFLNHLTLPLLVGEVFTFNLRRLHMVHAVRTFLRLEIDSSSKTLEETSIEGLSGLNESEPVMKHT
jgi:hypothetical protein